MPLPSLFGARDSARRKVWVNGLSWLVAWLLYVAVELIFDRFVFHDRVSFARIAIESAIWLVLFYFFIAVLPAFAKEKSGNELSITNTGSGPEGHSPVNRSSPEVKEQ